MHFFLSKSTGFISASSTICLNHSEVYLAADYFRSNDKEKGLQPFLATEGMYTAGVDRSVNSHRNLFLSSEQWLIFVSQDYDPLLLQDMGF